MDSVTHAVLGSVVCLIATRGKQPRKAIITGALIATLPDLDSLVPSVNHLEATISHRTWSHSWLVHTLVSPVLAGILHRIDKSYSWLTWLSLVWLTLVTHSGLDCFTLYGTDVFWPISTQTVVGGSVFIIDPLFTLPLLIVVIMGLCKRWQPKAFNMALAGLSLSCFYLVWGIYNQNVIEKMAVSSLAQQNLSFNKLIATPTPFNSILWRVLAMDDNQYHEGFYSKFDDIDSIQFTSFPGKIENLDSLDDPSSWNKLNQFAHGFAALKNIEDSIIGVDLRMGAEGYYFFQFKLADLRLGKAITTVPVRVNTQLPHSRFFVWVWNRLISQTTVPFTH